MGPMKVKATKDFDSFDIMFFYLFRQTECFSVRLTIKTTQVRLIHSLLLRPNRRIFLDLMCHFSFSCGNPARPRPGENTALRCNQWYFTCVDQTVLPVSVIGNSVSAVVGAKL